MTLLFYNRNQGKGEFYNIIDAKGNIDLLKSYSGWRKSWTHIVYSFTPSLLFYDRSGGAAEFYDLDGQGNIHLVSSTTYSTGWTHIILVGVVRDSGHAVLLFYNAQSGDAKFYRTNGQGGIHLLSSTTFSKGWTHIITNGYEPGAFTQENNYLVLFYNATSGVAQFYNVDIQGNMHQFSNDKWSTGWTHGATGRSTDTGRAGVGRRGCRARSRSILLTRHADGEGWYHQEGIPEDTGHLGDLQPGPYGWRHIRHP